MKEVGWLEFLSLSIFISLPNNNILKLIRSCWRFLHFILNLHLLIQTFSTKVVIKHSGPNLTNINQLNNGAKALRIFSNLNGVAIHRLY